MDTKDLENVKPDAVIDEIVENEGENARKDAPINGEDEAFKGGEKLEDRVKLLSPGRLVLKRFFRSKLSVIGLAVLIAFFVISFFGPLLRFCCPFVWGQDEVDRTSGSAVWEPVKINYIDAEGNSYETYETKEFDGFFRPIRSLNEKLDDLALNEVFTAEQLSSGVLSLLEPETKVNDIGDKVADKIQKSSLAKLGGVGVIDTSEGKYDMDNTPRAQRAFIWNNNLGGMLESLIKFVDSPVNAAGRINYDVISEPTVNLTKNSYTLGEFIAAYEQYRTLVLNDNVTITVTPEDAVYQAKNGKYYIPVFNLEGDAYTFNVTGGEVVLAAMEKTPSGAITLADHQFFYAYDATNGGNGSGLKYYDGTETDKSGTKVTMGVPGVATESFVEYKKIG